SGTPHPSCRFRRSARVAGPHDCFAAGATGSPSMTAPTWFALFQEGIDPFAEVVRLPDSRILFNRGLKPAIEFLIDGLRQEFLGRPQRSWTIFHQRARKFVGAKQEAVGINDFIHQSEAKSLVRGKDAPSQQQITRVLLPHLSHEEVRDDCW